MGKTVVSEDGRFEWDESKDTSNVRKQGVSFKEILAVFDDPDFLESYDDEHSVKPPRCQTPNFASPCASTLCRFPCHTLRFGVSLYGEDFQEQVV